MGAIWELLKSVFVLVFNATSVTIDTYTNGLKKAVKWVFIAALFILPLPIIGVWFNLPFLTGTYFIIMGLLLTLILFAAFPILFLARYALETFSSLRKITLSILMVLFWFSVVGVYFYVVPVGNNPRLIPLVILLFGIIALGSTVFSVKVVNPRVIVISIFITLWLLTKSFLFPETSNSISKLFIAIDRALSGLLSQPKQVDPVTAKWFDFETGKPLLYYVIITPCEYEFFSKGGYHSRTGTLLKPADLSVQEQWLECRKGNRTSQVENAEKKLEPTITPPAVSTGNDPLASGSEQTPAPSHAQPDERGRRLQEFKSLVKDDVGLVPGRQNISIFVATSGPTVDFSPEQLLYDRLSSEKAHFITDFFRKGTLTHGYFDEIYEGDHDLLKIVTTSTRVDSVILGRLNYTFRKSSSVANDVVCEIAFNYKVIGPTGDVVRMDVLPATIHPSYSESAALQGAIEALGKKLSERLSKIP